MRRIVVVLGMIAAVGWLGGCGTKAKPSTDCKSNADCAGDPAGPWCDVPTGDCVQCTLTAHCPQGYLCNQATKTCEEDTTTACTSNDDCTDVAGKPLCHLLLGYCVECLQPTDCESWQTCNAQNACEDLPANCDPPCSGDTPHCLVDTCVECLDNAHCEQGEICTDNLCVPDQACDINGFTAPYQYGFYQVGNDGPVLGYQGFTSDPNATGVPIDMLQVAWWFDYGANFNGVGTYPVEQGSNLTNCGLCVHIASYDASGNFIKGYFAVDGTVEITAVGGDGEPFNGTLTNVRLVEWSFNTDSPVAGGEDWCIDSHTWNSTLDGDLQIPECTDNTDCAAPTPICQDNVCVECSSNAHCAAPTGICHGNVCVECVISDDCPTAGDQCLSNTCVATGTCDITGYTAPTDFQYGTYTEGSGGPVLAYLGFTSDPDVTGVPMDNLRVEWWFDYGANFHGVGTYPVEQGSNLTDCGLCVYMLSLDSAGNLDRLFFAVDGDIEVTEVSGDGSAFNGVVHNVVLVEWDYNTDTYVVGGQTWCVDGHTWETTLAGPLPVPECTDSSHCSAPTPICHNGTCVECVVDGDCLQASEVCINNACQEPLLCDLNDFTTPAFYATGEYEDNATYGEVLHYWGFADSAYPTDALQVIWFFDYTNYTGVGTYPVEQGSTPATCGFCMAISGLDINGDPERLFFAVEGSAEITAIGNHGEPFNGVLHNVRFVEWDQNTNTALAGGQDWCVDGHTWTTTLDGQIP